MKNSEINLELQSFFDDFDATRVLVMGFKDPYSAPRNGWRSFSRHVARFNRRTNKDGTVSANISDIELKNAKIQLENIKRCLAKAV